MRLLPRRTALLVTLAAVLVMIVLFAMQGGRVSLRFMGQAGEEGGDSEWFPFWFDTIEPTSTEETSPLGDPFFPEILSPEESLPAEGIDPSEGNPEGGQEGEYCGNGYCNPGLESRLSCPDDCAPSEGCGDGQCTWYLGENLYTCPDDCPARCGDGYVTGGEECESRNDCAFPEQFACTDCKCVLWENEHYCGDLVLDPGEQCENTTPCPGGALCQDCQCITATCGDGIITPPEECDGSSTGCSTWPAPRPCTANCTCGTICGDGILERGEVCEPSYTGLDCTNGRVCAPDCRSCIDPASSQSSVTSTQSSEDMQSSWGPLPECGNGILESNEMCETNVPCPAGQKCAMGYYWGSVANCVCVSDLCGDGILDRGEECEVGHEDTCPEYQYCSQCTCVRGGAGGAKGCGDITLSVDDGEQCEVFSACDAPDCKDCRCQTCGDGKLGAYEDCDTALPDSCGFGLECKGCRCLPCPGGSSSKSSSSRRVRVCGGINCGNNQLDPGEECDLTAESFAPWCYPNGVCQGCCCNPKGGLSQENASWYSFLASLNSRTAPQLALTIIPTPRCGNFQLDGGEACEPGIKECPEGMLCIDCDCEDTRIICGNSRIDPGEQCEPQVWPMRMYPSIGLNSCHNTGQVCDRCRCEVPPPICLASSSSRSSSSASWGPGACGNLVFTAGEQCERDVPCGGDWCTREPGGSPLSLSSCPHALPCNTGTCQCGFDLCPSKDLVMVYGAAQERRTLVSGESENGRAHAFSAATLSQRGSVAILAYWFDEQVGGKTKTTVRAQAILIHEGYLEFGTPLVREVVGSWDGRVGQWTQVVRLDDTRAKITHDGVNSSYSFVVSLRGANLSYTSGTGLVESPLSFPALPPSIDYMPYPNPGGLQKLIRLSATKVLFATTLSPSFYNRQKMILGELRCLKDMTSSSAASSVDPWGPGLCGNSTLDDGENCERNRSCPMASCLPGHPCPIMECNRKKCICELQAESPVCGNGKCERGESLSCPKDCLVAISSSSSSSSSSRSSSSQSTAWQQCPTGYRCPVSRTWDARCSHLVGLPPCTLDTSGGTCGDDATCSGVCFRCASSSSSSVGYCGNGVLESPEQCEQGVGCKGLQPCNLATCQCTAASSSSSSLPVGWVSCPPSFTCTRGIIQSPSGANQCIATGSFPPGCIVEWGTTTCGNTNCGGACYRCHYFSSSSSSSVLVGAAPSPPFLSTSSSAPSAVSQCTDPDGGFSVFRKSTVSTPKGSRTDRCKYIGDPVNGSRVVTACSGQYCFLYEYLCTPVTDPAILKMSKVVEGMYFAKTRCTKACRDGACVP